MRRVVKTIYSDSKKNKVEFEERENGTFGFEEYKFVEDENAWIPFGKRSYPIVESLEKALAEAKGRIEWLR